MGNSEKYTPFAWQIPFWILFSSSSSYIRKVKVIKYLPIVFCEVFILLKYVWCRSFTCIFATVLHIFAMYYAILRI
jgi:hypothetical protein